MPTDAEHRTARPPTDLKRLESGLDNLETGGRQKPSAKTYLGSAAVPADRDRGDHPHLADRLLAAAPAGLRPPRARTGARRPAGAGRAGPPVAVEHQQHPTRRPGVRHLDPRRDPHRPRPRLLPEAARHLRPDPHRPAAAAVGGLGARRDHLVRPVGRDHLRGRPARRRALDRQRPARRHGPDPAHLPARGPGHGRQGVRPHLAHRPACRVARLPRRPRAGLGLRVALAHGRRAHRGVTGPRARASARCSTPADPSATWPSSSAPSR